MRMDSLERFLSAQEAVYTTALAELRGERQKKSKQKKPHDPLKVMRMAYDNGDVYEGPLDVDDEWHGFGTYTFNTGEKYTGEVRGLFAFPFPFVFPFPFAHLPISRARSLSPPRFSLSLSLSLSLSRSLSLLSSTPVQPRHRIGEGVQDFSEREQVRGAGECSIMYRYMLRESCSQFDSLPLTSLTSSRCGQWKENAMHGEGVMHYSGGDVYEGEWEHNEAHGTGKYTFAEQDVYHGEFRNGKSCGSSEIAFANGDTYVGNMLADERDGAGVFTEAATGSVWEGTWAKDERHGKFKMTPGDGGATRREMWRNGKLKSSR